MKIQLIDRNSEMCDQWKLYFADCQDVIIHQGDFFSLKTDCVVSPANSFGFMDGGLDLVISEKLGWQIQEKLQNKIKEEYFGELLVGQAELIETDNDEIPFCISAPTMRVPLIIPLGVDIYMATKAIFIKLITLRILKNDDRIKVVTISGLGTGVGNIPYNICAKQMKQAYDDVWLNRNEFPLTLSDASKKHYSMLWKGIKKWILFTDAEPTIQCDICDKTKQCVHFQIIGNVHVLCKDCVNELSKEFKKK